MDKFLGETMQFWAELKVRAAKSGEINDVREIAELRAKVSFYESRIKDMNRFLLLNKEI